MKRELETGFMKFGQGEKTELKIYCNAVELYRSKKIIEKLVTSSMILKECYENQKGILVNRMEEFVKFKDVIFKHSEDKDFVSCNNLLSNKNKVPRFTICEFEESLQNCIDFHDLMTVQTNFLDKGLDELKSFSNYQYLQYYLYLVATQVMNELKVV